MERINISRSYRFCGQMSQQHRMIVRRHFRIRWQQSCRSRSSIPIIHISCVVFTPIPLAQILKSLRQDHRSQQSHQFPKEIQSCCHEKAKKFHHRHLRERARVRPWQVPQVRAWQIEVWLNISSNSSSWMQSSSLSTASTTTTSLFRMIKTRAASQQTRRTTTRSDKCSLSSDIRSCLKNKNSCRNNTSGCSKWAKMQFH